MRLVLSMGALALGAALVTGMPVTAIAQEEGGETETAATENPNERVCRRVHVTGSNIPQRICMKRSEWTAMREESQEQMRDELYDHNSTASDGGSGGQN